MTDERQSRRNQGIAAFRSGHAEEAIELLKQAVADDPRDHHAYAVLGAAYVQQKKFDDAITAFEAARRILPDAAHIHYNLGLAYQRAGRAQDALAAFRAALEVDPSYEKAKDAVNRAQTAEALRAGPVGGPPRVPPMPGQGPAPPPAAAEPSPMASPAPWQISGAGAPKEEDTFQLRRLGGDLVPQAGQSTAEQPEGPPRAPWETDAPALGVEPRRAAAPPDRPGPPPRAAGPALRRPGPPLRGGKKLTDSDKARIGAGQGALYGALFMAALMVFDRMLGANYGVVPKTAALSWFMTVIGGAVSGIVFGVIVGVATVVAAKAAAGIYAGAGLWVFAAIIMLLRKGVQGTPMVVALALAAGYGVAMGWIIATQVTTALRREEAK